MVNTADSKSAGESFVSSSLTLGTINALVVELVDTLDLGSSGKPWEFESLQAHHTYKGSYA